ncbi:MAG: HD domain-containing phosphohydrolase [Candidatus Acidiferrales bacterium]
MPSLKQVWFTPGKVHRKWAGWLQRQYKVLTDVPSDTETQEHLNQSKAHIVCVADPGRHDLNKFQKMGKQLGAMRFIGTIGAQAPAKTRAAEWFAWLPRDASRAVVEKTVAAAFENLELAERHAAANDEVSRTENEMKQLHRIGIALSSVRDANAVLELILSKAREMTNADAGSIYLVEEKRADGNPPGVENRFLKFKLAQNDSVELPNREMTMMISEESIAGYVALHGEALHLRDAYRIPASAPYKLNTQFDRQFGYRTRSVLTLPMKNAKGEVLGVLQLINCKRDARVKLKNPAMTLRYVQPFGERAVQFALSLASQAAVSYENSKLYQDIETLFEGFVQAAVTAIEQRDPTTSGHSYRVSEMTCGLAEAVDREQTGAYAQVRFTREQMKEIRYAALLHDFGKVAVPEEVLVKERKLYPGQLTVVQTRFDYVRKDLEARYEKQKLDAVLRRGPEHSKLEIEQLESELREKLAELDGAYQFVLEANEPTVLPEGNFDRLIDIGRYTFPDPRGLQRNLLTAEEIRFLSIPQGSLDPAERQQIESHVVHSFNFLMQIPWTREIRGIPKIARAHHEKLNGTGYPYQLKGDEIPVQAKIMTVCDIFDALSASDRPYKKAVSPDRAIEILGMSVRDKELDPALFNLFVDAKIYQRMRKAP